MSNCCCFFSFEFTAGSIKSIPLICYVIVMESKCLLVLYIMYLIVNLDGDVIGSIVGRC